MEELAVLRAGLIAICLAAAPLAAARDLVAGDRTLVVSEPLAAKAYALQRAGLHVVLLPRPERFARARSLRDVARPFAVLVTLPLRPWQSAALKGWADGGCEVVAHAPLGLTSADLEALAKIGPCAFRVHVPEPPHALASKLGKLRPVTLVWELGGTTPSSDALLRFAKLGRVELSVDEANALPLSKQLARRELSHVTLAVRAPEGRLSGAVTEALAARDRAHPVRVVAQGGLDPLTARRLRGLTALSLEVDLSLARTWPADLDEALTAFARPVDGLEQRRFDEAEADAPLLRFD